MPSVRSPARFSVLQLGLHAFVRELGLGRFDCLEDRRQVVVVPLEELVAHEPGRVFLCVSWLSSLFVVLVSFLVSR